MNTRPHIIITGASSGLGAACARWAAKAGAAVTLLARREDPLAELAASINQNNGEAGYTVVDVTDYGRCDRAVRRSIERFGRIDALINNAGVLPPVAATHDADPQQWRANMEVNLLGPFHMFRAAAAALREARGRVVNISSGAAEKAIFGWSAYCASKAGLTHLTQVMAAEEPDLTVTAIRPGVVDTDMQALIRKRGPGVMPDELADYFIGLKRDGRLEPPEVPARSVVWLALRAPGDFSGRFLDYDDPAVMDPAIEAFGERP